MRRGTVQEAAAQEGLDPATVRRKIQTGVWPCLRRGSCGPGNGAILDLDAIRKPAFGLTTEQFAGVLWTALHEDHADVRAGCPRDDAAAVCLVIWESPRGRRVTACHDEEKCRTQGSVIVKTLSKARALRPRLSA